MMTQHILQNGPLPLYRTIPGRNIFQKAVTGVTVFIILTALPSCSLLKKNRKPQQGPIIKYMNLKAVYNYMVSQNKEYSAIKRNLEVCISQMHSLEKALSDPRTDHIKLLKEYTKQKKKLSSLNKKGSNFKGKILSAINRAVKNEAKEIKADYILNISDDLLYAKKEYDITEDIIRELLKLKERSDPVSR